MVERFLKLNIFILALWKHKVWKSNFVAFNNKSINFICFNILHSFDTIWCSHHHKDVIKKYWAFFLFFLWSCLKSTVLYSIIRKSLNWIFSVCRDENQQICGISLFCTILDSRFSTLFNIFLTVLILFLFYLFFSFLCIFLYTLCILLLYGILTAFILSWYIVFVNRTMATACSSLNLFAFSCLFLFKKKILLTCLK